MINSWQIKNYLRHFFTAKRNGHGVHSPFVYAMVENIFSNKEGFYAFHELKQWRIDLLKNEKEIAIHDLGAGSNVLHSSTRKVSDIANYGISSVKQSEFYFKLINYFNCKTIIELGTSIGLNTLYLSMANPKAAIYTIEGDENLNAFAKEFFATKKTSNITALHGSFDSVLPSLLKELGCFDLLYIDGNHTCEATLRYFNMALAYKEPDSILIFDDIYWRKDMTKAWEEIKAHPEVKVTVDCFYFGMVFFKKELKQKEHFKLFL